MDFMEWLRPHQGYLERVALALLGNRADAEDAVQEAVLDAYRNRHQLRGGQAAFGAWVRRILLNQCRRAIAKRRGLVPIGDLAENAAVQAVPGPDEEATDLWNMVSRLGEHLRQVIVLHYMLDYSQAEIADYLGIPLGTVKSRLGKALSILRRWDRQEEGIGHDVGRV